MAITVGQLASQFAWEVRGDHELVVTGAQSIDKAGPRDVTFVSDQANLRKLKSSKAGAVITSATLGNLLKPEERPAALIIAENVYSAFVQALERLRPRRLRAEIGISPRAIVSPTAKIGPGTNIFPGAYVGDGAVIGRDCDVYPGAVIGDGCRLGDCATIYPNAVLYPDTFIGNRSTIHASAVIGADGFGYRLVDGRHSKLPHFGTVRIEDDVEVGACSTVDRAMIGATVIGEGTKLDNLVMIAHNCEIGRHNLFVAQSGVAGSVTTGQYVVCAGQAGVADHVHLGDGCVLGSRAGAHKDIPAGKRYIGAPAMPESEAKRMMMAQKRIPETRRQVRELEYRVARLEQKLAELAGGDRDAIAPAA
jgi:UDP-3-O-[3-hydroxymyristoyl] glucosamine N-acyltransferase